MMTIKEIKAACSVAVCALLLPFTVNSQTGPGGVGSPTTVGYWIDVESNGGVNGASVSTMKDYSAGGIDAVQTAVGRQPVYQTGAVNGRSALFFDGTTNMVSPGHSVLNGATYLNSYVFGDISYSGVTIPFSLDYGTGNFDDFSGLVTINGTFRAFGRGGGAGGGTAVRASLTTPAGYNMFECLKNGTSLSGRVNYSTTGTVTANTPTPATHVGVRIGGRDLANAGAALRMTGHIAEAFVLTAPLNTAEENILQNYMAAKYGAAVTTDMYDYELDYGLGVVGIGRDNATNEHNESIGNGIVRISKAGLADGDYLFIGHDGTDLTSLSTNVPSAVSSRFERLWRMDEPTDIGAIDIVFELDASTDFSPDPLDYQLLINSTDDFSTVTSNLTGTYDAVAQTLTFTGIDMAAGDYFTLGGGTPPDIISIAFPGDWNTPSTWDCTCVPSVFNKVTIATGTLVTVTSSAIAKEIIVESGGFAVLSPTGSLELTGDLTVNPGGNIASSGAGEVSFTGTTAQNIDLNNGTVDLSSLTIDNLAGVTLSSGTFTVNDMLSPLNGDFDVTSGGLIVRSISATTSGRVGEIGPNASITGDVTVERFIPSGLAGNRNLSSSVIGADLSEWDADILISGTGFPDGCAWGNTPTSSGCYHSVKKFQGGATITNFTDVTNPSEPLTNGDGFEVFLGDNLNTFSGVTIKTTGTLNSNADFATPSAPAGWNLVGNPYASPITFQMVSRTRTGNYFYIFDVASGSYQWYDGSNNTASIPALNDGKIAMGQGFWTFVTGSPNNLNYKQTAKISTNATFIRDTEVENGFQLTLSQDNSTYYHVSSLVLNEAADDAVDEMDIQYLSTGLEKASSLYMPVNDSVQLTKNYLLRDGQKKVIDFNMKTKTEGYYTISPSNLEDLQDYSNVHLFDKSLSMLIDLKAEGTYTFYATEGDEERFTVILSNDALSSQTYITGVESADESVSIKQLGHTLEVFATDGFENATLEVTNILGQQIMPNFILDNSNAKQFVTIENNHHGIFIAIVKSAGQIVATKKIIL